MEVTILYHHKIW